MNAAEIKRKLSCELAIAPEQFLPALKSAIEALDFAAKPNSCFRSTIVFTHGGSALKMVDRADVECIVEDGSLVFWFAQGVARLNHGITTETAFQPDNNLLKQYFHENHISWILTTHHISGAVAVPHTAMIGIFNTLPGFEIFNFYSYQDAASVINKMSTSGKKPIFIGFQPS